MVEEGSGTECVNCGKIFPQPATVCPNCSFREIESCPYCSREVPRLEYVPVEGEVFQCPHCRHKVRFRFAEPLANGSGLYNEPLVLVSPAEIPAEHAI